MVHGVVHDVQRDVVHRVDLRAEVVVMLLPLVAEADLRKFGVSLVVKGVGIHVGFLVVYWEEFGAFERELARRPAKGRVISYAREREGLATDDLIHPRNLWGEVAREETRHAMA